MSLQAALVAIKTANSTLNTLVDTRFYPDKLPQKLTLPAVRFQEISSVQSDAMMPSVVNRRARVQMDGYAETSVLRSALRAAMLGAFYGYSGSIAGQTIKSILLDNEQSDVENLNTERESYRVSMDFMVDFI